MIDLINPRQCRVGENYKLQLTANAIKLTGECIDHDDDGYPRFRIKTDGMYCNIVVAHGDYILKELL